MRNLSNNNLAIMALCVLLLNSKLAYSMCESPYVNERSIVASSSDSGAKQHFGFTGMEILNGHLYIAFRRATAHTTFDGDIEVYRSPIDDLDNWVSIKKFSDSAWGYRDPYLIKTGPNQLTIGFLRRKKIPKIRDGVLVVEDGIEQEEAISKNMVSFYDDLNDTWTAPETTSIDDGLWLWKAKYYNDNYYGITHKYSSEENVDTNLFVKSADGVNYSIVADSVQPSSLGRISEVDITKLSDDTLLYFGRGRNNNHGQQSFTGYDRGAGWVNQQEVKEKNIINDESISLDADSPFLLTMSDDTVIAIYRDHQIDGRACNYLAWFDYLNGKIYPLYKLPGNKNYDTGYAEAQIHSDKIFISYFDSFVAGEKTNINLIQIPVADVKASINQIDKEKTIIIEYEAYSGESIVLPLRNRN